ncbi:uncharacterized protein LOC121715934 isoform X2 [Alosa sapidissima]|uniref:uncharacterized protein LOC121715934 isoform X2 n=1 Tax=Alosa sapidissima TaxID=34773 RepID=UPI001C09B475|nr:uncharacterized protein LOC121715934 isoform X2 [Alosa sapidissima]
MGVMLALWSWLLTIMVWNVCGYPIEGPYAWHSQPDPDQMIDPRYMLYPGSPYYQQQGPPQTPEQHTQTSQESPVTSAGTRAFGPQTSSASVESAAAPIVYAPAPSKGAVWSPVLTKPQASPKKPLPGPVAEGPVAEAPVYVLEEPITFLLPQQFPTLSSKIPYKPGKVIQRLSVFESGNEASEFHDGGLLPLPVNAEPSTLEILVSEASAPLPSDLETFGHGYPYPEWDDQFFQMFITGQLPVGTVTHFSTHYEHGKNAWTDVAFERMVPPRIVPLKKAPAPPKKAPAALSSVPNKRKSVAKGYPPKQ